MSMQVKRLTSLLLTICFVLLCVVAGMPVMAAETEPALTAEESDVIAYAIFGEEVEAHGMSVWMGNKNPKVGSMKRREAWVLDTGGGSGACQIYVDIDDSILFAPGDGTNLVVDVEYYDGNEMGSMAFTYYQDELRNMALKSLSWDTGAITTGKSTEMEYYDFGGVGDWTTKTWEMQNAAVNNSSSGADFCVSTYTANMGYSLEKETLIRSIKVRRPGTTSQVEISFDKEHLFSHNFYTGQNMVFNVVLNNYKNAVKAEMNGEYEAEVTYTLFDENTGVVNQVKKENVTLKPSAAVKRVVSFEPPPYGTYRMRVDVRCEELGIHSFNSADAAYIKTTYGEIRNEREGVNLVVQPRELNGEKMVEFLVNMGFRHVRLPGYIDGNSAAMAYGTDKTRLNEYATESTIEEYRRRLSENGFVIQTLVGAVTHKESYIQFEAGDLNKSGYKQPKSEDGVNTAIERVVERMRFENQFVKGSSSVALINEPDLTGTRDEMETSKYTGLQYKQSYSVVKELFPDVLIAGPVTTSESLAWMRNFLKYSEGNFDVYDTHSYVPDAFGANEPLFAEGNGHAAMYKKRQLLDEYGYEDKELWITEWGAPAYGGGANWAFGQIDRMQKVANAHTMFMYENIIDRLYVFNDVDRGTRRTTTEDNYGLLSTSYVAHPIACMLSNQNILYADADFVSRTVIEEKKAEAYRFKKTESGQDLITFMNSLNQDGTKVSLDLGTNNVTLIDVYGNETELYSPDGTYTFTYGKSPIYVLGNFTDYKFIDSSAAGVTAVLRAAVKGGEVSVPIVNTTGEKLDIVVTKMSTSETAVTSDLVVDKESDELMLYVDPVPPKGCDYVYVELKGSKGTYFAGPVGITYEDPVETNIVTGLGADGEWCLKATMSNISDADYKAEIELLEPAVWAGNHGEVVIPAKSSKEVEISLPAGAASSGVDSVTLALVRDGNMDNALLTTQDISFTSADMVTAAPTIDGKLDEWNNASWIYLNNMSQFMQLAGTDNNYSGADDLSAKIAVRWDEDNLYFAAEVTDDIFVCETTADNMWSQDSVQLGIAYDPERAWTDADFEELALGLLNGTPTIYRHKTVSNGAIGEGMRNYDLAITKNGNTMYYELRIGWDDLHPDRENHPKIEEGSHLRFGCIINEGDGGNRKGFLFVGKDGIGNTKESSKFLNMYLDGPAEK